MGRARCCSRDMASSWFLVRRYGGREGGTVPRKGVKVGKEEGGREGGREDRPAGLPQILSLFCPVRSYEKGNLIGGTVGS